MSLGDAKIPSERAKKAAERKVRLDIGNLPHLGDANLNEGEYVFPILISVPRVVFQQTPEGPKPTDVKFMEDSQVGEVAVDKKSGNVVQCTPVKEIEDNIQEEKKELERAVQRALIKSAAQDWSRLSYPKHRQTPVMDILSEIILNEKVDSSRGFGSGGKYADHVSKLIEVGLVKEENGYFQADNKLKQIIVDEDTPSNRLNSALAYLFEQKSDDLTMMNEFLGPHLEIAGYYYRRSIESESLPKVTLDEFRREIASRHSGKKGEKRAFKSARYLIQLEEIGILKISELHGNQAWQGKADIQDEILSSSSQLGEFAVVG